MSIFMAIPVLVVILVLGIVIMRRRPRRLRHDRFVDQWQQIQACCRDKKQWPDAVLAADSLLDSALKKRKFSGKSMGERMVSAQRTFSDNDLLWFAHNLSKKIKDNAKVRLKEDDVKDALIGFRQALRDLGALPAEAKQTSGKNTGDSA